MRGISRIPPPPPLWPSVNKNLKQIHFCWFEIKSNHSFETISAFDIHFNKLLDIYLFEVKYFC